MRNLYWVTAMIILLFPIWIAAEKPAGPPANKPEAAPCPPPPEAGKAPLYKEVKVTNPGSLSGRVSFTGKYVPAKWKVVKDNQFCGETVIDESLVVSPKGGLQYVVVSIDDIREGKPLPHVVKEVANKDCRYQPHVEALCQCDKLMITNHDPILHNTHGYIGDKVFEPQKPVVTKDGLWMIAYVETSTPTTSAPTVAVTTLFNLGLPTQDFKPKKMMRQPGLLTLKCDAGHTWMTGFVWVKSHPYVTVTDAEGRFTLTDIPAGEHTVTFWHERLGTKQQKITITQGKTAALDLSFALK